MITHKDYAYAALIGFFAGIFAIPALANVGVRDPLFLALVPWLAALLLSAGVWLGGFLGRWVVFLPQFAKFVAVGFLNTAIDFGILNLLSSASGVQAGFIIGGVNVPGFTIAIFNSYLWNQLWVFRGRRHGEGLFHDFPKFLAVIIGGVLINSGIVIFLTTFVHPLWWFSPGQWLNIAKALATVVTLVWNFIGFKFLVFRVKQEVVED